MSGKRAVERKGKGDDKRKNRGKGSCRRKNEETRLKKGEKSEENLRRRNLHDIETETEELPK